MRAPVTSPSTVDRSGSLPQNLPDNLIVFDGVCVMCSAFAKWIVRADSSGKFSFVTAQSPLGQRLLAAHGLRVDDFDSNLVIIDGKPLIRLDGMIAVCAALGWPWRALRILWLLPQPLRDWLYERLARNRYSIFGKKESCDISDRGVRERLIE